LVLVQFNYSVTLIDTYEHTNLSEGEGATVIKLDSATAVSSHPHPHLHTDRCIE